MLLCPLCSAPCSATDSFCCACGGDLESADVQKDSLVGRTLPGGYRVSHLIGVGGMGRVYCAEQVALGRTVAVKVVHPHLAGDELAAARFLNEARAASRLSHPNTVAVFDFGRTAEGQPYIVMEYLRGRDLGRVAQSEGPLPLRRVADVMRQTLAALEEAHALGIVHRDLKPDNIVLEPLRSGLDFVKVVDFGLAKILESEAVTPGSVLTRPGLVCGTPEYMSPEQGRGDPLDGRADLYSLAVVLFELLTGRIPFLGESATKMLLLHLDEPPPDPRDVSPYPIAAPLAELTLRGLAKRREDRFQDARAFAEELDRAVLEAERVTTFDAAPQTSIRCGACGMHCPIGQKFCGECGASIAVATPSPPRTTPPVRAPEGDAATVLRMQAVNANSFALPLLAREDALQWLDARRHEADALLAAAHVVGETGSGKTRLLDEFLEHRRELGDHVFAIAPDPTWAKVGDAAVRAAIEAPPRTAIDRLARVGGCELGGTSRSRGPLSWRVRHDAASRHGADSARRFGRGAALGARASQ